MKKVRRIIFTVLGLAIVVILVSLIGVVYARINPIRYNTFVDAIGFTLLPKQTEPMLVIGGCATGDGDILSFDGVWTLSNGCHPKLVGNSVHFSNSTGYEFELISDGSGQYAELTSNGKCEPLLEIGVPIQIGVYDTCAASLSADGTHVIAYAITFVP